MTAQQPARAKAAPTPKPIEAPQARFHPVPVRPVFLPGSYTAPQTLQQLPPGTSVQLQGPRLDEPPPFPEPEEVGPAQPSVDAAMTLMPALSRPTREAWVFMPGARDASAEKMASNPIARDIPTTSRPRAETSHQDRWKSAESTRVVTLPRVVAMSPSVEPLRLVLPPAQQLRPAAQPAPLDEAIREPSEAAIPRGRETRPVWSPHRPGVPRRTDR